MTYVLVGVVQNDQCWLCGRAFFFHEEAVDKWVRPLCFVFCIHPFSTPHGHFGTLSMYVLRGEAEKAECRLLLLDGIILYTCMCRQLHSAFTLLPKPSLLFFRIFNGENDGGSIGSYQRIHPERAFPIRFFPYLSMGETNVIDGSDGFVSPSSLVPNIQLIHKSAYISLYPSSLSPNVSIHGHDGHAVTYFLTETKSLFHDMSVPQS